MVFMKVKGVCDYTVNMNSNRVNMFSPFTNAPNLHEG